MSGCSCPLCLRAAGEDPDAGPGADSARIRIAVVASATCSCTVCGGEGHLWLRAVPEGAWVKTRCPHCRDHGVPYFPLPWHQDTERNTA